MYIQLRKTTVETEFVSWMVRNKFLYRLDKHYKTHGGYRFVYPDRKRQEYIKLFIDRDILQVDDVSLLAPLKRHIEQQLFQEYGFIFKHE